MPKLLIELIDGKDGKEMAVPETSSQLDGQEPEIINGQKFERPLTVTCPGMRRRAEKVRGRIGSGFNRLLRNQMCLPKTSSALISEVSAHVPILGVSRTRASARTFGGNFSERAAR
jgi:hypothetical protein